MSQTPGSQTLLGYLEIFWGISKETRSSEEPGNSYSDSLEWQTCRAQSYSLACSH